MSNLGLGSLKFLFESEHKVIFNITTFNLEQFRYVNWTNTWLTLNITLALRMKINCLRASSKDV